MDFDKCWSINKHCTVPTRIPLHSSSGLCQQTGRHPLQAPQRLGTLALEAGAPQMRLDQGTLATQ